MPSIVLHMISCPVPFVVLLLPVCLGLESAMVGCLRCGPFLLHYLSCCPHVFCFFFLRGCYFSLLVLPFLHACLITVGSLNHHNLMITNVPKRTGVIPPGSFLTFTDAIASFAEYEISNKTTDPPRVGS